MYPPPQPKGKGKGHHLTDTPDTSDLKIGFWGSDDSFGDLIDLMEEKGNVTQCINVLDKTLSCTFCPVPDLIYKTDEFRAVVVILY